MAITQLPPGPDPRSPGTFNILAPPFVAALPTFGTEANVLADELNSALIDAEAAAVSANVAAGIATATVAAIPWVSGTTYTIGAVRYSLITPYLYRRITAGAGTTDPSADTTNWALNTIPYTTIQEFAGFNEAAIVMPANDINLNLGGYFTKTITGNTTFTVSNVPATGKGNSFILEITNGGAGTITWWANMKFPGGTAPQLTLSGVDVLGFFQHTAGSRWTMLLLGRDVR